MGNCITSTSRKPRLRPLPFLPWNSQLVTLFSHRKTHIGLRLDPQRTNSSSNILSQPAQHLSSGGSCCSKLLPITTSKRLMCPDTLRAMLHTAAAWEQPACSSSTPFQLIHSVTRDRKFLLWGCNPINFQINLPQQALKQSTSLLISDLTSARSTKWRITYGVSLISFPEQTSTLLTPTNYQTTHRVQHTNLPAGHNEGRRIKPRLVNLPGM